MFLARPGVTVIEHDAAAPLDRYTCSPEGQIDAADDVAPWPPATRFLVAASVLAARTREPM